MIASFGDRTTEAVYHGHRGKERRKFHPDVIKLAERKLDALNSARELRDLAAPPGNRLEALRGRWAGYHSIRVNDQWRIVFRWLGSAAHDVRIVDYH